MGTQTSKLKAELRRVEAEKAELARERREMERQVDQTGRETEKRVEMLSHAKKVLEMKAEILTEMVATEQVNVKLQVRRSEALKWELLRQGTTQEHLDQISLEAPELALGLKKDPAGGSQNYSMADAINRMVVIVKRQAEDLRAAFHGRDKQDTGVMHITDFKDALKEVNPSVDRMDCQLLSLRFSGDNQDDDHVDYKAFMLFFERKIAQRKLDAAGSKKYGTSQSGGGSESPRSHRSTLTIPVTPASAGSPNSQASGLSNASMADMASLADVLNSLATHVKAEGPVWINTFEQADPAGSGVVTTKVFSDCMRQLAPAMNRIERKVLYNEFCKEGAVNYRRFLECFGVKSVVTPVRRASNSSNSSSGRRSSRRLSGTGSREDEAGRRPSKRGSHSSTESKRRTSLQSLKSLKSATQDDDAIDRYLAELAEMFKAQPARVQAAFEEADPDAYGSLNEEDFIAVLCDLLPESKQSTMRRVYARFDDRESGGVDYCNLLDEVGKMFRSPGSEGHVYKIGQKVDVRQESMGGGMGEVWEHAVVTALGEHRTYTVNYNDKEQEEGVPEQDMRELVGMTVNPAATAGSRGLGASNSSLGSLLGKFNCCKSIDGVHDPAHSTLNATKGIAHGGSMGQKNGKGYEKTMSRSRREDTAATTAHSQASPTLRRRSTKTGEAPTSPGSSDSERSHHEREMPELPKRGAALKAAQSPSKRGSGVSFRDGVGGPMESHFPRRRSHNAADHHHSPPQVIPNPAVYLA
ncbi:unnamed protein product [Chrysoparadoxa australica]